MENKSWTDYCISMIPKMKARFKQMMGREPDLVNPKRFTDKLEWLKAYDSTFLKTYCADKILVREYVKKKIGKDISIPLLGTFKKIDDIDFSKLPKDYVIKTNHGSHTNIIVRDGKINKDYARKKFNEWLSKDWSWWGYEMHYVPIKRQILIEQFMNDGNPDLTDYKFYCFNGKPTYCQVIANRHSANKHLNWYDMAWRPVTRISSKENPANYNLIHEVPKTFEEMKEYAIKLSADFKFVRVDFYEIHNKVYFGELTFIPAAAYIKYTNDTVDFELGELLIL